MKRLLPVLLAVVVLASCTTVPSERDSMLFVTLINDGDWEAMSAKTASPFLLDTEMIMRPADMKEFWKTLAEGGFSLGEAQTVTLDEEAAASRYGSGIEIEQFFAKYVPDGAVTFLVSGGPGRFYMTVGKEKDRRSRIYAFAGPVQ